MFITGKAKPHNLAVPHFYVRAQPQRETAVREDIHVRQIPGERKRRWFSSDNFDLIVWLNDNGTIAGFELCYDKTNIERSLVWRSSHGFDHMTVDDGEHRYGKYKASPILVPDGHFDAKRVYSAFAKESHFLPKDIAGYVLKIIEKHPNYGAAL